MSCLFIPFPSPPDGRPRSENIFKARKIVAVKQELYLTEQAAGTKVKQEQNQIEADAGTKVKQEQKTEQGHNLMRGQSREVKAENTGLGGKPLGASAEVASTKRKKRNIGVADKDQIETDPKKLKFFYRRWECDICGKVGRGGGKADHVAKCRQSDDPPPAPLRRGRPVGSKTRRELTQV